MKILQESFLYRLLAQVVAGYPQSVLGRILKSFQVAYATSVTRSWMDRALGGPDTATEQSGWTAFWLRWNSACARIGRQVTPLAEQSGLVRLWKSEAVRQSLLYRVLFSYGMQRLLIVLFALYLPIDYVLRTYSPIQALASVWDEGFLLFGFGYVLFKRLFTDKTKSPRSTPFDVPLLVFLGLSLMLVGIVSPYMGIALAGLRAVIQYMFWFYLLTRIIENDGDLEVFGWTMAGLAVAVSVHGIAQFVLDVPIPSHWVSQAEVGVRTRIFSIFGSPNIMGSFCVMTAPLTASFAYRLKPLWAKILLWTCTLLICIACLLTFSRGAWLGMAVAVFLFAILQDRKLIALMALAVGAAVFIPQVANRITFLFTSEFDYANMFGGRGGRRREGLLLLQQSNLWFGFGLGRFGGAVAMQNQIDMRIRYFYMDNYYLKTLVEMGYVGLIGYLLLLLSAWMIGLRSVYRARTESISTMAKGLLAGLTGVLVHCMTENVFEVPYMNAYFWGMFAIVVYIGFLRKDLPEKKRMRL